MTNLYKKPCEIRSIEEVSYVSKRDGKEKHFVRARVVDKDGFIGISCDRSVLEAAKNVTFPCIAMVTFSNKFYYRYRPSCTIAAIDFSYKK